MGERNLLKVMATPLEIATRWFNEVWNERNDSLISELMSSDAKGHLEGGCETVGTDGFRAFQQTLLQTLPDLHLEILNTLADGDDACILWNASGTHSGHAEGFLPTGKSVVFRGMTWFRIIDGKIVEGWDSWDKGTVMQTLCGSPVAVKE